MRTAVARFDQHLNDLGIPIHGVSRDNGVVRIFFKDNATAQQRATAEAEAVTFDWTEKEVRPISLIRDAVKLLSDNDRNRILDRIMADYLVTDTRFAANLGIAIET